MLTYTAQQQQSWTYKELWAWYGYIFVNFGENLSYYKRATLYFGNKCYGEAPPHQDVERKDGGPFSLSQVINLEIQCLGAEKWDRPGMGILMDSGNIMK